MTHSAASQPWYERSYGQSGFSAQRRYPNEELLRFFGRYYFALSSEARRDVRVLEVGCGSGANLWMIAKEGFDAHGIDLSPHGIALCASMLEHWGETATLKAADMTATPYPDGHFQAVVDVFSSFCLDEVGFAEFLSETSRLLAPGGRFFSYAPSKGSDAFTNPGPSRFLDSSTLDGIQRLDAPYYGNAYPFRFVGREDYVRALTSRKMRVNAVETVGRTYRNGEEYFEFVVVDAERRA
jgi:SAM-dependent methyltransferase